MRELDNMEQPNLIEITEKTDSIEIIRQRLNEIPGELSGLLEALAELCQKRSQSDENINTEPLLIDGKTNDRIVDRGWSEQIDKIKEEISSLTVEMQVLIDKLDPAFEQNPDQQNLI
jgi:prefoldin subunit 5